MGLIIVQLEIWPGYGFAVETTENGNVLNVDVASKVCFNFLSYFTTFAGSPSR